MDLWINETGSHYSKDSGRAPVWLPLEHKVRWERLRQLQMLFEGKHREYYLEDGRTEFDFPEMAVQDRTIRPYRVCNLLKLFSVKTADLLFGARVRLTAPTRQQSDAIDLLARRSLLHSRFHAAVVTASWAGGAFLLSEIWNDEPYITQIPPTELYPLGQIMPNGQYERYVRYATANIGTAEKPIVLLLTSVYGPGTITRKLQRLAESGRPETDLPLNEWPAFAKAAPAETETLGIAENPITYIANEVGGVTEISDYDGLIGEQDAVNAKFTQVSSILAKHADPPIALPATAAKNDGSYDSRNKAFYFNNKEEIPQYIMWTAELEAAIKDRTAAVNSMCMVGEMSQVLLGLKDGAAPDAARKLRLEATNTLAKVGRKALLIEPAIGRSIEVALKLDQTTRMRRSYPVDVVGVEPRDGLPIDEKDEADTIAILRGCDAMSLEAAVERRIEDPDAAATELARLKAEAAAKVPTVFAESPTTNTQEAA